jgi:hypothetical protein
MLRTLQPAKATKAAAARPKALPKKQQPPQYSSDDYSDNSASDGYDDDDDRDIIPVAKRAKKAAAAAPSSSGVRIPVVSAAASAVPRMPKIKMHASPWVVDGRFVLSVPKPKTQESFDGYVRAFYQEEPFISMPKSQRAEILDYYEQYGADRGFTILKMRKKPSTKATVAC